MLCLRSANKQSKGVYKMAKSKQARIRQMQSIARTLSGENNTRIEISVRWHPLEQRWEQKPKGDGNTWTPYPDRQCDGDYTDNEDFIKTWATSESVQDVAQHFGKNHRSVKQKRNALNRSYAKLTNKPKFILLKDLPEHTQDQKDWIQKRFTKKKNESIVDIVAGLDQDILKKLGLENKSK